MREDAIRENLMPKKEKDFYHEHIDVIVRENYISSDSDEEELANKIKEARLNTAKRTTTAQSRAGTSRTLGTGS